MATIHNPTNFEPADYEVIDYLDNKRPVYFGQGIESFELEVRMWEAEIQNALGTDWRRKMGHCVHCGNGRVRWITAVKHVPTGDMVVFGSDCTDRLGFANKVAFKLALLQSRAEARKVRFKIYTKRQEFIAANPAIAQALADIEKPEHARNTFVRDVLRKLDQYGTLSARQVECVISSMNRDREAVARKAVEALEIKGDAPEGRQTVTGEVLATKVQESDFGPVVKMLVKLENNARVWVSAPSGVERGQRITFTATFERSNTDRSFGFGKRPHLIQTREAA